MQRPTEPDYDTKARLHLGVDGQIVRWDNDKGFGFVATQTPPLNIFFHASVLQARHLLPQNGEQVKIKAKYADGKWTATEVGSPRRRQAEAAAAKQAAKLLQPMRDKLMFALPLAGLWLLLLALKLPKILVAAVLLSLLCAAMYAWDKQAALSGRRRIPEAKLNLFALLGGWPGALLARYTFRHKTVKQPFVALFWVSVLLNVAAVLYILFKQPESLALLWR